MDTGEGMGYGECYEMCKPNDSQTCTLGQIIHYMSIKIINLKKNRGLGQIAFSDFHVSFICTMWMFLVLTSKGTGDYMRESM